MQTDFDVVIVGGGPAGLYCAYQLITKDYTLKICVIDKGNSIENRKCPAIINKTNCVNCKTCSIMSGVGGCGSYSDGKYPITNDFGGTLWKKIGKEKSLKLQNEVDDINYELYKKYWDRNFERCQNRYSHDYGFPKKYSSKNSVYKKICTQHNLHLLDADIRHLGTDNSQLIYKQLYDILVEKGIMFMCNTEVLTISQLVDHNLKHYYQVWYDDNVFINVSKVVVAAGRSGSSWVNKLCENLDIPTKSNKVDIGIRFECPDEIWNHITKDLYESKIIYKTKTYEDTIRTFCMNPSGEVVTENTNGLTTVNGHAYESQYKKTNNTNFALLVSQSFTEPFDNSNEYGEAIIRLSNMLGGGVIVQRYGDLIRGKRSTKEHIENNTVSPTLKAEPGDLSLVLPKRILDDIIEMIQQLDHLVPGMTNDDNLLYGVECKFYNSTVEVTNTFEPENYKGLYFMGDGSGWTHSLSQASANGLYVADCILEALNE